MRHDITFNGTCAQCSCGYSCVCMTADGPPLWAEQHKREFDATCEHSGAPLAGRDHAAYLHDVTDDELRAECSRRCMTAMSLSQWSDELLRAECDRRFGPDYANGLPRVREGNLRHERDEWKRRAELAESRICIGPGAIASRPESGPGIAAMPARDTSHWFDPIDLLAEDA